MPGGEILRSYDLVNWEHAAFVYDRLDSTPGQIPPSRTTSSSCVPYSLTVSSAKTAMWSQKRQLDEDAQKLADGLDTTIYKSFDEKGVELSGGQQQKTAISRALYRDAPIVILIPDTYHIGIGIIQSCDRIDLCVLYLNLTLHVHMLLLFQFV